MWFGSWLRHSCNSFAAWASASGPAVRVGVFLVAFFRLLRRTRLQRQPAAEESDGRPPPALRQPQRPVDGLGTGRGVAALLLDDRLDGSAARDRPG